MSRMRFIAVPVVLVLAAGAVAGCGSSGSSDSTTAAAAPATPPATTTDTTATPATPPATTTTTPKSQDLSDATPPPGGFRLGKAAKLTAANGGALTVTFLKLYDPVKSVSNFDPAPKGMRYIGVTLTADYQGLQTGVVSSASFYDGSGSKLSSVLLADPSCGRNLVNIELLGKGLGKRGCIVGLAPKGTNPKMIVITLLSGTDRSKSATARVPL